MNQKPINVKILIVDDRPENLLSLESIIEGPNREIIKANSGNEALKLALHNEFGLILTDVQMPEMDGFEMVEILRINPKMKFVPVIFVTAISKEEKFVHKGYNEGAVDYLFKPLDPTIVAAKTDVFVTLYQQKKLLEQQNTELKTLNQTKNKFLGMAAHDLRNPLSVIQYYTKALIEDSNHILNEDLKKKASVIDITSRFTLNIVDELLDVTKIESGTFEINKSNSSISDLIDHSVKINNVFAEQKNIELIQEISSNIPPIALDNGKMNQVLNNLISNAVKYSPKGTIVTISAKLDNDKLLISVKDEGQGIPAVELDKLFQPFQTTSVKSTAGEKSTGLGLTIVHKIVEAHEGSIWVESEVGKGSNFMFSIPAITLKEVVQQSTNELGEFDQYLDRYRGNKANVLVCEDDRLLRLLIQRVLNILEIPAEFAESGEEGLKKILANDNIDFILTDINMPGMDGYEFSKKLQNLGKPLTIVALTGNVTPEIEEKCKESGMVDCAQKPLNKKQLEALLSTPIAQV